MNCDYECVCEIVKNLRKEINQLKHFTNKDTTIKFKKDEIFLLSISEYKKYKKYIPIIDMWWWLRSPGSSTYAAIINYDGFFFNYGEFVYNKYGAIRPALRLSNQEYKNLKTGDIFIKYKFPWVKISEDIAIAEVPIAFHRFDEKSNDYENSEIRKFLLNWIEERK